MIISDSTAAIGPALLAAQKIIGTAVKGAVNTYFNNAKYADLENIIEAIKKPLNDEGILVLQGLGIDGERAYVETCLMHVESGE